MGISSFCTQTECGQLGVTLKVGFLMVCCWSICWSWVYEQPQLQLYGTSEACWPINNYELWPMNYDLWTATAAAQHVEACWPISPQNLIAVYSELTTNLLLGQPACYFGSWAAATCMYVCVYFGLAGGINWLSALHLGKVLYWFSVLCDYVNCNNMEGHLTFNPMYC